MYSYTVIVLFTQQRRINNFKLIKIVLIFTDGVTLF